MKKNIAIYTFRKAEAFVAEDGFITFNYEECREHESEHWYQRCEYIDIPMGPRRRMTRVHYIENEDQLLRLSYHYRNHFNVVISYYEGERVPYKLPCYVGIERIEVPYGHQWQMIDQVAFREEMADILLKVRAFVPTFEPRCEKSVSVVA